MGKLTISMAMFNSYVTNYQRVTTFIKYILFGVPPPLSKINTKRTSTEGRAESPRHEAISSIAISDRFPKKWGGFSWAFPQKNPGILLGKMDGFTHGFFDQQKSVKNPVIW